MNKTPIETTRIEKVALAFTAVCSLIACGGVLINLVWLMTIFTSLVIVRPALGQSTTTAAVRLESGIAKEDVDGDLKSAIEIYRSVADDQSAPRDVRAKALLRLAGCDEKLGKQQAKQLYEQVVRDYADQPAATQARSRLAALKQQEHSAAPTPMALRKIEWSTSGIRLGASDTDGLRAVYRASDENLYFGDLAGHSKRLVFKAQSGDATGWVPSRDFSIVLLHISSTPNHLPILAVVKTDGTGYRELIRDSPQQTVLGHDFHTAWSWDNRSLLVWTNLPNGDGHLFIVSVADGRRRELSSTDSGTFGKAVFSPDGRYVAYSIQPQLNRFGTSRFFVIPAQGGQARLVYESGVQFFGLIGSLLDWTADGRNLAMVDVVREDKTALFLLPMRDGSRAGTPIFVRYGNFEEGFTTSTGSLVYRDHASVANGGNEFFIASFDPKGHLGDWQTLHLQTANSPGWNPWPSFSSDGRQIAYVIHGYGVNNDKLVLRDVTTGQERLLHQSTTPMNCQYARQTPKVFCTEFQTDGQQAVISLAVNSGAVERLGSFPGVGWILQTSYDERTVYELKADTPALPLISLDLATRQETKLEDGNAIIVPAEPPLLARISDQTLMVRPIAGGAWKTLIRLKQNTSKFLNVVETPDGTCLLYQDSDSTGKNSLFRIPLVGGQPERVADLPVSFGNQGFLRISPDGRQLIAVIFRWDKYDLWVLDHFVPETGKQSGGAR